MMGITKARKQGNSLMVTIPKSFKVKEGTSLKPKLTDRGILYEFVDEDDFFNFDEEILEDLVNQGYEGQKLIVKFKAMRRQLPQAMDQVIQAAEKRAQESQAMTKEELEKELGL